MKAIKRTLMILACMTGIALCAGCKTAAPTTPPTPEEVAAAQAKKAQRIQAVCKLAAATSTVVYVREHPEHRAIFEGVRVSLGFLLDDPNVTPDQLQALLSQLPLKELKGGDGAVVVTAAIVIYDEYVKEHIALENANVYWLKPAVLGLYTGLSAGLSATAPPPPPVQ